MRVRVLALLSSSHKIEEVDAVTITKLGGGKVLTFYEFFVYLYTDHFGLQYVVEFYHFRYCERQVYLLLFSIYN